MENQHVLDTYYYKFPSQEEQHQRENQRNCRSGLPRIGNVIINALNTPEYESQVRIERVLKGYDSIPVISRKDSTDTI